MGASDPKLALLLGAGFAKPWGLPLTAELMRFEDVKCHRFPGEWQQKTIAQIEAHWLSRTNEHGGSVDTFGRLLRGTPLFEPFVRYVALRLSSHLWHVGGAQQTKWGTGDHIARIGRVPSAYGDLILALEATELVGVVTTNYDILVEKLLGPRSRGRLGGFNYGQRGQVAVGRHYTSSMGGYGPVELTGCVPLAKVHGSLNWAFSETGDLIRYVDCRPSRGRRYRVAVFPPGETDAQAFRQVFDLAQCILSAATVWLVIGYSLPDGDEDVRQLLACSASKLDRLCVIDPHSCELAPRFASVVGKTTVSLEPLPGLGSLDLASVMHESLSRNEKTA